MSWYLDLNETGKPPSLPKSMRNDAKFEPGGLAIYFDGRADGRAGAKAGIYVLIEHGQHGHPRRYAGESFKATQARVPDGFHRDRHMEKVLHALEVWRRKKPKKKKP